MDKLKVAVLIDGGFLVKHINKSLPKGTYPQASDFINFAKASVDLGTENLFRIFYYDSPPYDGKEMHPILKKEINYKNKYREYRVKLLEDLASSDFIAFRSGTIRFQGWKLSRDAVANLLRGKTAPCNPKDVEPNFKQKCVDMKIGLDVAWLSSKRIIDRIILVSNDLDFIPPMKHARREGVQVVVVEWAKRYQIQIALRQHSDLVRVIEGDCRSGFKIKN